MTGTIDGAPALILLACMAGLYAVIVLAVVTALWFASRRHEKDGTPQPDFYSLDCLAGIHKACPYCHCTHHLAVREGSVDVADHS